MLLCGASEWDLPALAGELQEQGRFNLNFVLGPAYLDGTDLACSLKTKLIIIKKTVWFKVSRLGQYHPSRLVLTC